MKEVSLNASDVDLQERRCFIISPIGSPDTDVWKRSDQVLRHILSPAAEAAGYVVTRSDKISEPGIITSQVINRLINDDLVIADLTGHNPNVFYELAVRHAVRMPVIQVIHRGETIPFDINQNRTIFIDHSDLDLAQQARSDVERAIAAIEEAEPGNVYESPIQMAIDLTAMKSSDNVQDRATADVLSTLSELLRDMREVRREVRMSSLSAIHRAGHLGASYGAYNLNAAAELSERIVQVLEVTRAEQAEAYEGDTEAAIVWAKVGCRPRLNEASTLARELRTQLRALMSLTPQHVAED